MTKNVHNKEKLLGILFPTKLSSKALLATDPHGQWQDEVHSSHRARGGHRVSTFFFIVGERLAMKTRPSPLGEPDFLAHRAGKLGERQVAAAHVLTLSVAKEV